MKTNIIDFESKLETCVSELICIHCGSRAVHTWPKATWIKELECPDCHIVGGLIATGQILPKEKEQ